MHFGEYELSPSLISLSPLPSSHPKTFQRQTVRSSTLCYQSFNLLKGRSLGFASTHTDYSALLRLGFPSAAAFNALTLLRSVTRRSVLQKVRDHRRKSAFSACKHTVSGSFSLPSRGTFHLSLTVLVHYRSSGSI